MVDPEPDLPIEKVIDLKILGAIQILTGCVHFCSGATLCLMNDISEYIGSFASIAFLGGYPFWGGVSFIISGSLSISTSKKFSPSLIKSSLGMNVVSSIFTLVGVSLLLRDMSIKVEFTEEYETTLWGKGISALMMIFSLLEFCIACATAHFTKKIITDYKPVQTNQAV